MSKNMSLREQVENIVLFATNSKDLEYVVEEVLNFVRNQKKNAIKDFLLKRHGEKNESFLSKRQGKKATELFKR